MTDFRYHRPSALPPMVKYLIILNVLVWIAELAFYGLINIFALYPVGEGFKPYQIATHMFTHGSWFHIIFNMLGLWMFGRALENVWGPERFLRFYLICGVGAALMHLIVQYLMGDGAMAVGASGAVMGILAAFAYLFPNTEMFIMFIPIPVKAKWAVLGMIAYDLFGGFNPGSGIAHFAHLGGALTGFILVYFWYKKDRRRFY